MILSQNNFIYLFLENLLVNVYNVNIKYVKQFCFIYQKLYGGIYIENILTKIPIPLKQLECHEWQTFARDHSRVSNFLKCTYNNVVACKIKTTNVIFYFIIFGYRIYIYVQSFFPLLLVLYIVHFCTSLNL